MNNADNVEHNTTFNFNVNNIAILADYVFEASWEVCNKVGGIHTVISSKASVMMSLYNNYFLIGPYFENNARNNFIGIDAPAEFANVFEELKSEGIICHFGKWLEIKGKPITILIEFNNLIKKKNDIKTAYWLDFGIDSLRSAWDFDEPLLWSYAVGRMIGLLEKKYFYNKKIIGHFHEWLAGPALLYLKKNNPNIATVFTTHATVLGRTLCSKSVDIYNNFDNIDIMREVYNNLIESKFLTERASAINADAFTTVSEITSLESEKFLGRKADVLVLNGLDSDKFPGYDELSIKHVASRDKIKEFISYYFFPYYAFDVNNSLLLFTVGRYEYTNKGYDMIIRALGRINNLLKKAAYTTYINPVTSSSNPPRPIIMFFWVPMGTQGIRLDVLENKNYYLTIKEYIDSAGKDILNKIVYDFISKKNPADSLFTENFISEIKKDLTAFERKGIPPLSTHIMDEYQNNLLCDLHNNGLLNRVEDVVKIIVQPVYLTGNDGLLDMGYYDAMIGCDLGLFPSYYEPWGYTPLESASLGVPALTTDLAGFGRFINEKNGGKSGVFVLKRFERSYDAVLNDMTNVLLKFYNMSHSERVNNSIDAKSLSLNADWKNLVWNYVKAHNFALEKKIIKKF